MHFHMGYTVSKISAEIKFKVDFCLVPNISENAAVVIIYVTGFNDGILSANVDE